MITVQENNHNPALSHGEKKRVHIDFLDGIRGLAALYIVLHHFLAWQASNLPQWAFRAVKVFSFGHTAVGVFIILSGFSLMLPVAQEGSLRGGWRGFLVRRARRILPPYYAALVMSILSLVAVSHFMRVTNSFSGSADLTWPDLLSHLLLLHNWSPTWIGGFNMALWSVATEWQIYFLLPLLLLPVWCRWGLGATVMVGFLVGLIPLAITLCPGPLHGTNLSAPCFWYLGLFATGAAGAVVFVRASVPPPASLMAWSGLIVLCYGLTLRLLPAHSTSTTGPEYYLVETLRDGLMGSLSLCLILYCAAHPCLLRRLLESGPLRGLGAFSYSLYLTHCIILGVVNSWGAFHGMSGLSLLGLKGLAVPIALGFAYLFYLAFERPFVSSKRRTGILHLASAPSGSVSNTDVVHP